MAPTPPTIAMIHATTAAIVPASEAFAERFPEARLWNLLDDRLLSDAEAAGEITSRLNRRMLRLIDHALEGDADAVLLTCSLYGRGAEAAAPLGAIAVMASDEAMLRLAVAAQLPTVAVVGSLESSVADTTRRLEELLAEGSEERGRTIVTGIVAANVAIAVASGNRSQLHAGLRSAMQPHVTSVDAFLLAQYSLSPVAADLQAEIGVPVLSPPHLAADALRERLGFGAQVTARAIGVAG